ncbi:MAG: hypothetical protein COY19_10050 [Candidatus Marinimicrobia bacterium CG_4_10_14_0_2_um_filter_48_9]|nr:MAG: hypothetical protein COY19_10050 [Candidatus Marinimicrobia bacterium CG_4_10_14_0_2_um_filter_48_9]
MLLSTTRMNSGAHSPILSQPLIAKSETKLASRNLVSGEFSGFVFADLQLTFVKIINKLDPVGGDVWLIRFEVREIGR